MSCEAAQDSPSIHFQPAFSVSRAQLGQLVSRQQQPAAALGTERGTAKYTISSTSDLLNHWCSLENNKVTATCVLVYKHVSHCIMMRCPSENS